jgi:hypothetical protein
VSACLSLPLLTWLEERKSGGKRNLDACWRSAQKIFEKKNWNYSACCSTSFQIGSRRSPETQQGFSSTWYSDRITIIDAAKDDPPLNVNCEQHLNNIIYLPCFSFSPPLKFGFIMNFWKGIKRKVSFHVMVPQIF